MNRQLERAWLSCLILKGDSPIWTGICLCAKRCPGEDKDLWQSELTKIQLTDWRALPLWREVIGGRRRRAAPGPLLARAACTPARSSAARGLSSRGENAKSTWRANDPVRELPCGTELAADP